MAGPGVGPAGLHLEPHLAHERQPGGDVVPRPDVLDRHLEVLQRVAGQVDVLNVDPGRALLQRLPEGEGMER